MTEYRLGKSSTVFVDKENAQTIINDVNKIGYNAFLIGSMVENNSNKSVIFDGWNF